MKVKDGVFQLSAIWVALLLVFGLALSACSNDDDDKGGNDDDDDTEQGDDTEEDDTDEDDTANDDDDTQQCALQCNGNWEYSEDGCECVCSLDSCPPGKELNDAECICEDVCENDCVKDSARCATETTKQICGQHDDDPCDEWGAPVACGADMACDGGNCEDVCFDECTTAGAQQCMSATANATCGQNDTDPCLEWGSAVQCATGMGCINGACTIICADECAPSGTVQCASATGLKTCGNSDTTDICLEWGAEVACPANHACNAGVCELVCIDDCTAEAKECSGAAAFKTCGQHDADPCLDWSTPTNCGLDQTCSNGLCNLTCLDECTMDAKKCSNDIVYKTCGNFDGDICTEWSEPLDCGIDEVCDLGVCKCANQCIDGDTQCTGGYTYKYCRTDWDADACTEWYDGSCTDDWGAGWECVPREGIDYCMTRLNFTFTMIDQCNDAWDVGWYLWTPDCSASHPQWAWYTWGYNVPDPQTIQCYWGEEWCWYANNGANNGYLCASPNPAYCYTCGGDGTSPVNNMNVDIYLPCPF